MSDKPVEITRREFIRSDLSMLFRVGEDLPFWVPLNQIEVRSVVGSDSIIQVEAPEDLEEIKKEGGVTGKRDLRKNWRNIWCILRSIDRHEVQFSDPYRAEEWKFSQWPEFRDDPHAYFVRCEDVVADAIWAAVDKQL